MNLRPVVESGLNLYPSSALVTCFAFHVPTRAQPVNCGGLDVGSSLRHTAPVQESPALLTLLVLNASPCCIPAIYFPGFAAEYLQDCMELQNHLQNCPAIGAYYMVIYIDTRRVNTLESKMHGSMALVKAGQITLYW